MQCITLALLTLCCLGTGYSAVPASAAGTAPAPISNFYLQLKSIVRTVPHKQIQHLVRAYMLNDAEYQALIREINSMPAFRLYVQLLNQPEVRQFVQWLSQQLVLAGGSIKVFDDLEVEIKLFNKYPYWAQSVAGIAGFQQEFQFIYPLDLIRNLLETSAKENAVFGEFWQRLVALKPVYDRLLATTQAQHFVNRLRNLGVDVDAVDAFVRYQFGWSNATIPSHDYDYDYQGSFNNAW